MLEAEKARKLGELQRVRPMTDGVKPPDVLVVGLGNPILGDDGVGWKVVQHLDSRSLQRHGVELDCLAVGGLSLMERMLGYRRVILVDAITTGRTPLGTVSVLRLTDLQDAGLGHSGSAHDASLNTALHAAAALGATVPKRIDIVAIEAQTGHDFTEDLTAPIAAAVPVAAANVLELIETDLPN